MAAEYNKKTVPELQEILKARSLSHNGKKAELVARITKDDEDKAAAAGGVAPAAPAPTTDAGKTDTAADDVIDWDDDTADNPAKPEDGAKPPTADADATLAAAGGKGEVPNPVAVPNQQLGEDPAKDHDLKVASEGAKPEEKTEKPEAATGQTNGAEAEPATTVEPKTGEEKTATTTTATTNSGSKGLSVSEMEEELQKRKARAEKFGISEDSKSALSESEKQLQRAKRFGTGGNAPGGGVRGLDRALPERPPPRKRGRNDYNQYGGRVGKRQNFGGGRGGRQGYNNRGPRGPSWNERDQAAIEARRKRFTTTA